MHPSPTPCLKEEKKKGMLKISNYDIYGEMEIRLLSARWCEFGVILTVWLFGLFQLPILEIYTELNTIK